MAVSAYAAVLLFAIGAALAVFVMILSTRERVREIGRLKAIGASNGEVAIRFLLESVTVSGLSGVGALLVAASLARGLARMADGIFHLKDGRLTPQDHPL